MTLSRFLQQQHASLSREWDAAVRHATNGAGRAAAPSPDDAAAALLRAVAQGLATRSPDADPVGPGTLPDADPADAAAADHGRVFQRHGGSAAELADEFAVLRALVLRRWHEQAEGAEPEALDESRHFHQRLDRALVCALRSHSRAAAQSRDTFLAVVGHDLRNPLGSLAGCLELLENPTLPRFRRQRSAEIARRSVKTIDSMVTDLLEYTRTRLGQSIQVHPAPADLAALCREAVEETQAAYPRCSFVAALPDSLPAAFDAPRLRQVLTNLLSNAVHHGEAGSPITLSAGEADAALAIEVRNLGRPIPPDLMQAIFDPLVQIPAAASDHPQRPVTSLGLGLFIAKEIVVAHGGRIDVASSAEAGTTFTVVLPREPAPAPAGEPLSRPRA